MPLPLESASHTAAAKKAVEVLGLHFADSTGLPVVLLRLAAIYGPLYHSMANLPSRLCHAAVRRQAPNLDGVRGGPPPWGQPPTCAT
jgi:UDP-glucose 4-epimerase